MEKTYLAPLKEESQYEKEIKQLIEILKAEIVGYHKKMEIISTTINANHLFIGKLEKMLAK